MKKRSLYSFLILLGIFSISTFSNAQNFGDELSDAKAIEAKDLRVNLEGKETINVKVEGEIAEVCQMSGCWMKVKTGDENTVRVTFKDYGFFVPKDAAGRTAVFEGEAKIETIDVKTLQHYAEDAGKSKEEIAAITEPETKLTFVAKGVEIQKK